MYIKELIEAFMTGVGVGVYYWYSVVFNYKVPKGICWLIAILSLPINILVLIVGSILKKNFIFYVSDEMVNDIIEKEEA